MRNCEEKRRENIDKIVELNLDFDSQEAHQLELDLFLKLREKHNLPPWSQFLLWKPKLVSLL